MTWLLVGFLFGNFAWRRSVERSTLLASWPVVGSWRLSRRVQLSRVSHMGACRVVDSVGVLVLGDWMVVYSLAESMV